MSLPLIVHSKLFWFHKGQIDSCWYLGLGDGTTVEKQDAYIADMNKFGIDTITINICNEAISSPFVGEFMNSPWRDDKVNLLLNFIQRLKAQGKIVVIVFFDFPAENKPKYPFWKFKDRIPLFLEIVTTALSPHVDGFILGIETNRQPGPTIEEVEAGISHIQRFAVRGKIKLPVGTHEQNMGRDDNDRLYLKRRVPLTADFVGYETSNHPHQGDSISVARMVQEINFLVANSYGKPVWVIESNSSEGVIAINQNRAMAALPGIAGVGGVL